MSIVSWLHIDYARFACPNLEIDPPELYKYLDNFEEQDEA